MGNRGTTRPPSTLNWRASNARDLAGKAARRGRKEADT